MKNITHIFAVTVGAIAGFLLLPPVHTALLSFAGKQGVDSYAAVLILAAIAIAGIYHNPKAGS